ncbi:MAG: hypothetical protein U9N51_08855 [Bacteroidota bacterium]|nr:hypothetical protein [Bacteroidota bacterium]
MIPVNYNNNKCICIEEVFQDSINLRIFNLKNGNELLTIKHPKPFDWFLRSGLKNHLLFSERNGNFILLNLDTKTTDYYKASDFGIINRDFFTLRSFSPDGTYLVADFKETKENEMLTMENTISGYKLFSEESLLVELSLENGALKFNDTITYGFKKNYFWGEDGFGLSYTYIDKLDNNAYILTSPYNDEIFFINEDSEKSIKVKSKLRNIAVDVEPYNTYEKSPRKFNENISDNYANQPHISSINYDKKTERIHLEIWNGKEKNMNLLTLNCDGKTLAESTINMEHIKTHFYYQGKQYFIRKHNYEKNSHIYIDVYQYISK